MLDIERLDRTPAGTDPCVYVHVPGFIRAGALAEINRDYPDIRERGNFPPEDLQYGPAFAELLAELGSPELKAAFERKFGVDLQRNPLHSSHLTRRRSSGCDLEETVRKLSLHGDQVRHARARSHLRMVVNLWPGFHRDFKERWQAAGTQ